MTGSQESNRISKWTTSVNVVIVITALALVWSYWTTFVELNEEWSKNPLYSHGYLVPVFAAALLYIRRDRIPKSPLESSWWALTFLIVGAVMRLAATYFFFAWPDRCSLLFMMFAAVLAVGGWPAFRWAWPSIFFLGFMIPFPGFVENAVMRPLQRIATISSTNVLQTLGLFAHQDGNVIVLSEAELGIVEACSGLRMLSVFVALTVGACFVLQRPVWQKVIIILSSFPIAVVCNVARISATGIMYEIADRDFAEFVFHDVAGWLMMPLALLLLLLEIKILDFIYLIDPTPAKPDSSQAVPVPG